MKPHPQKQYQVGSPVVVDRNGWVYGSIITDNAFVGHDGSLRIWLLGDNTSVDVKNIEVVKC